MNKDLEYYMNLQYKTELRELSDEEGGGFIVENPELGRLSTNAWGETVEDALLMLKEIRRSNIKDLLQKGMEVPEPQGERTYSGRINLRMPPTLHQDLVVMAEEQKTSLNQLINNILSSIVVRQSIFSEIRLGLLSLQTEIKEGFEKIKPHKESDCYATSNWLGGSPSPQSKDQKEAIAA